ncbi:MAG: hypothetical protein AAF750_10580 [Planctomycetota bacterium]
MALTSSLAATSAHPLASASTPVLAQAGPTAEAAAPGFSWVDRIDNLLNTGMSIFSRPDTLAQPEQLTAQLANLSTMWALLLIVLGVVCLINGYKYYKVATLMAMLAIGSTVGFWLGGQIDAPKIVMAACLGVLLAVVAFPLTKYAVAVLGGLSGAFIGANLWAGMAAAVNQAAAKQAAEEAAAAGTTALANTEVMPGGQYWIGALIGLVLFGLLAFILFKLSIVLFTSVAGATLAVFGVIALLMDIDGAAPQVVSGLKAHQLVVPLLVFVPAVIGFVLQEMWGPAQPKSE